MKKAMALILATLILALATPFAMSVSANEAVTEIEVTKFSVFGNFIKADGLETPRVGFYGSYNAPNAFDGDIATDAQLCNNDGIGNLDYEMCYFNPDGGMVNGVNHITTGKSYYVMFKIELNGATTVDTLSLWTTYAMDGTNAADKPYMANDGYDIYYSADGESYYAVEGASFEDVYAKQSTADALYVAGTYNEKNGHVHEIDMKDVTAKYIIIAVSDLVVGADEAIVSEVVVMGTPAPEIVEPDNGGADNGGADNGTTDTDATDTDATDTDATDTDATDTNAPDTNAPDTNAPGTNAPGTDAPETDAATEGGCASSIAMTGVVLVGTCAAMLAIKSKKKDEE